VVAEWPDDVRTAPVDPTVAEESVRLAESIAARGRPAPSAVVEQAEVEGP